MSLPVYQTIALDLARRIINQEFSVGEKISGRTLLAGQYSVSPETIRKAIFLLKDGNYSVAPIQTAFFRNAIQS